MIVRRLEDGSVRRLATIAKTVSESTRERRPSPREEKCSSSPSRRKYDQAAATAPKLGEAEALDIAGLDVGALRISGESLDDAVELAGLAQLGHLAQAKQRPVGVLPLHADGLDERQVLVGGFATAMDRPLHEHANILQHCKLPVKIISPLHPAPES